MKSDYPVDYKALTLSLLIRELRGFGVFSVTYSSLPEISKVRTSAREETMRWQMGAVRSTMEWNIGSMNGSKAALKRKNRGASGTLEKLQKSRNSLQRTRKRMSRESEGMEKIFCRIRQRGSLREDIGACVRRTGKRHGKNQGG